MEIDCHDERNPELVRPWAQMMARAMENRVFVVAANSPADAQDLKGSSHGQSRIIRDDGNVIKEASYFGEDALVETLRIAPGRLTRPLEGLLGEWWKSGVEWMRGNLGRKLK